MNEDCRGRLVIHVGMFLLLALLGPHLHAQKEKPHAKSSYLFHSKTMSSAESPVYPEIYAASAIHRNRAFRDEGIVQPGSSRNCNTPTNPIGNCGFEDLPPGPWVGNDLTTPTLPLRTDTAGVTPDFGIFTRASTEGNRALLTGWDGNGPGLIELHQDVVLPVGNVSLKFDYRAGWDLLLVPAKQDRQFEVWVEPQGGGEPMQTRRILTAQAGTKVGDTGDMEGKVDLSTFSGREVRIKFVWTVPENFSGPALFQLDNVSVDMSPGCAPGPTNLCLKNDRFKVEVTWRDFAGNTGYGQVVPLGSADSGLFWFFDPNNWEMLVKVLDGCSLNGNFWIFSAATTDVEYTLMITDTESSVTRSFFNPLGQASPAIIDTAAFATCP